MTKKRVLVAIAFIEASLIAVDLWLVFQDHRGRDLI